MTELDDDKIRGALFARVSDEDAEIRGEALIGLARRGDQRVLELVRNELRNPFRGDWPVEAAGILSDKTLHKDLKALRKKLDRKDQARFKPAFDHALEACSPSGST